MKLIEALRILGEEENRELPLVRLGLVCGFTPMHFQTFLGAHFRRACDGQRTEIKSGLYGDFWGNLEKLHGGNADNAIVVMEWGALDDRLALRGLGSWSPAALADILSNVQARAKQFVREMERISREMPVAIC